MTKSDCADPIMNDRLLNATRPPLRALALDELGHLGACQSCRVAVERARRILEARQTLAPAAAEIAAARARFEARRRRPVHPRATLGIWPRAIAMGLVLAAVASAAAQIVAHRRAQRISEQVDAAGVARRHHHHPRRQLGGAQSQDTIDSTAGDSMAGDSIVDDRADDAISGAGDDTSAATTVAPVVALLSAPSPRPGTSPVVAPTEQERERAPAAVVTTLQRPTPAPAHRRRHLRHRDLSTRAVRATLGEQGDPAVGTWGVAAEALRVGDQARAESALAQLAQAADLRTRDAARLARDQLWLAQGRRVAEANGDLESLAGTGATPLIRQRAREALGEAR